MDVRSSVSSRQRVESVQKQFLASDGLPFEGVNSEPAVQRLLEEAGVTSKNRLFAPVRTTLAFF